MSTLVTIAGGGQSVPDQRDSLSLWACEWGHQERSDLLRVIR